MNLHDDPRGESLVDAVSDLDEKIKTKQDSSSVTSSHDAAVQYTDGVDVVVYLIAGAHADDDELSPEDARRIRNKLDWHLLPLLFLLYTLQFIDKSTLGASAILGIKTDNHLTTNEWNNLGSAFYIGFIIFEWPHNWAMQRFPVAKWLSLNFFIWHVPIRVPRLSLNSTVLIGLHSVVKNYAGLFALRFFLGASEGCMTAGLMIITSMFYTRTEIGERIGWTFQCNGLAQIITGFISFGVFHTNPDAKPNRWQWFFIVVAILMFFSTLLFLWQFPDNPTSARFLTEDEKVMAIKRVQGNQNGIETKVWKKGQFIEAITDVKTWLFFAVAAIADLQNGIANQYSLIISSFGFTNLQTTLLNIPSGVSEIIGITTATLLLRRFPNGRAWIAVAYFIPSILAALLSILLPFSNNVGLLCAIYVQSFGGAPGFVMLLAWVTSVNAGHTKRLTTNGIFMIGYSLGQILCTQFWKEKYKPRNRVPWGINLASYIADIILILAIRTLLSRENKRRDRTSGPDADRFGYVERVEADGKVVRLKVEKAFLDMTDKENQAFRYVL